MGVASRTLRCGSKSAGPKFSGCSSPRSTAKFRWEVASTDPKARDGAAVMKRVLGHMGDGPDAPAMNLTMYTPAKAAGPVPMILTITFGGGPNRPAAAVGPG